MPYISLKIYFYVNEYMTCLYVSASVLCNAQGGQNSLEFLERAPDSLELELTDDC